MEPHCAALLVEFRGKLLSFLCLADRLRDELEHVLLGPFDFARDIGVSASYDSASQRRTGSSTPSTMASKIADESTAWI